MIERTTSSVTDVTCRARVWIDWDLPASPIVNPRTSVTEQVAGNDCNIIEAPWLVHGGHGASLRHHCECRQQCRSLLPWRANAWVGESLYGLCVRIIHIGHITYIVHGCPLQTAWFRTVERRAMSEGIIL
jgi:hypothetical protein